MKMDVLKEILTITRFGPINEWNERIVRLVASYVCLEKLNCYQSAEQVAKDAIALVADEMQFKRHIAIMANAHKHRTEFPHEMSLQAIANRLLLPDFSNL